VASKIVIITGASRGLGAATAQIAAELGAGVVINARSTDELAVVAQRIREAGGQAVAVAGDVSRPEVCRQLVTEAVERFGGIDAVVNNAGVVEPISAIGDSEPRAWERNLAINFLGPVMLTQAALPFLRERAGRVINISSGAAINSLPGLAAYCSAKAALNQFTRVLAEEEQHITAIAVRPGVVDTAMQKTIREEGGRGMREREHTRFLRYYEEGQLLDPELPGRAIVVLALYAPRDWSGTFIAWDDDAVRVLVRRHAAA
jgi:NAD(P)-dependent dehydrogenase (short-subunit alcohol dehydrogenase family)